MYTLHEFSSARSPRVTPHRVAWLLEELGAPYELVLHRREPGNAHSTQALRDLHPLGKAPVLVYGGRVLAGNTAILEYLARTQGDGHFGVREDAPEWPDYLHWLHFAEALAMPPLRLEYFTRKLGDAGAPLHPRINAEIDTHLAYLDARLTGRDFLVGGHLTVADINNGFVLTAARKWGRLGSYARLPRVLALWEARPAYQRALARVQSTPATC